jgi:membrane protein
MRVLGRSRADERVRDEEETTTGRPMPDEAPEPQPEHEESQLAEPGATDLSKRDYVAIVKRAGKESLNDHITNLAAALAYYAFLAIPALLLVVIGLFSLWATPDTVNSLVEQLGKVMPAEAVSLVEGSLTNMTQKEAQGAILVGIGGLLALWSMGGAMQNLMWALNLVYDRDESRGFIRRRSTAFGMVIFVLLAFVLVFGLLILGPHLSSWIGDAIGSKTMVEIVWWVAQWPLLLVGLLLAFSVILFLGPNVRHPRWKFLSFGAVVAVAVWLIASGAFAFYASKFGSYNKAWGSLSAVVVMLTWLWLSSLALLFGAEINAEAERSRELRRGEPAQVELQAPAKA